MLNMPLFTPQVWWVMFPGPFWLSFKSLHDCCCRQEADIAYAAFAGQTWEMLPCLSFMWVHAPAEWQSLLCGPFMKKHNKTVSSLFNQ